MKIEVFSDLACPWCYIGKKRLMQALELRPELEAKAEWMPFQLQPGLPPDGLPWETFMTQKFGGMERMKLAFDHVAQVGKADGLEFNFGRVARAINTAEAHRLVLWSREPNLQWQLADALFKAHFTEGKNLNDPEELLGVVASVGLDLEQAREFLASGELRQEVQDSQKLAQKIGVQGVPFFIFDRRYALSGAQPLEQMLRVIDHIQSELQTQA